jgi:acetolactate synthase-1/2/3 large subunit
MSITVSTLIVKYLEGLGTKHIFGIPGAHILPVFDALLDSDITAVLTKHEQGAAFMAGGYARHSGNIGTCIATAGPGATNLATGLANAYMDRLPVIAFTGETPTYSFGKGCTTHRLYIKDIQECHKNTPFKKSRPGTPQLSIQCTERNH